MSSSEYTYSGQLYARWREANAAASDAAEKVLEATRRWERGEGDRPSDEQLAEADRLLDIANDLLAAASEDQKTKPAPLS